MKILYILDLYSPHVGGVEVLFENLISRISEENTCIILTSKYKKDLLKCEQISKNIEIYRVGSNRYNFMFFSLFLGFKLAKKSDIIHTTTYNSAIPAYIIGKLSGKKVVLTVHEIFGKFWYTLLGWKGFFFRSFESLIFKFSFDAYLCVSNYTKNSLRIHFGIQDKFLKTIYNAIDYDYWNKDNYSIDKILQTRTLMSPHTSGVIGLFFGRPGISKGVNFYIAAIPDILKKIPSFHACLIMPMSPNNPGTDTLKLIKKLNLEKYVTIIPGVPHSDLPYYILGSDMVVLPSLAEGFGFAIAEVSALGKKLITTNVAAIPEVASGDIVFVEASNSDEISHAVFRAYTGDYNKTNSRKFLWDTTVSETLSLYNRVIGK